jgi:polysaccharide biosynthesis/export protein
MLHKMGNQRSWRWVSLLALVFLCPGCSGNRLTLFPERHNMLESAWQMRQVTPIPPNVPRELDKHVLPAYLVEPGDVLLVAATDLDSAVRLPGDQPILPDGTISLGRYGHLVVAGKTIDEIEGLVRGLVQSQIQSRDPGPISVRLVSRQSKVFYVLGEVNAPGAYPLSGRETVLDGILAAGGLNERASRQDIVLTRPTRPGQCRVVLPVCYREIVQLGDTTTNYQLAPGDRIFVPSRTPREDLFGCRHESAPCGRCQIPCLGHGAEQTGPHNTENGLGATGSLLPVVGKVQLP